MAWRAWTILSIFSVLTLYVGHEVGERQGLLWAVTLALCVNAYLYFYGDLFLKPLFSGNAVEGQDPWHLNTLVAELTRKALIPAPGMIILPHASPQAFALGRTWRSSKIYLTEGLLKQLDPHEIRAVLAFEMALIKRQDTLSLSVASALTGLLFSLTHIMDWIFRWLAGNPKKNHSVNNHLFTFLFSPLAGALLRLTLSPDDYYKADALAASWLTEPKDLAQALWKLQFLKQSQPMKPPLFTSHLFVVNPLTRRGWTRYLHMQPSVEGRIRQLVGYYPL